MKNQNFHAATFDLKPVVGVEARISHDGVGRVAGQFRVNIARARCIMDFIHTMTHFATLYERSAHRAIFKLTGHVSLTAAEAADPLLNEKLNVELHKFCDEEMNDAETHPKAALRDEDRTKKNLRFLMDIYSAPVLDEGVQRIFQSMITGAWTAFEVMASDLWETALNAHPVNLASLAKVEANKSLEFSYLERHGYDLSKMMGTVHKESGRFKFQVLRNGGIRDAFITAFRKDGEKVVAAISDESLDALSLMRNVLVHSAGETDKRFLDEGKAIGALSKWTSNGVGHVIELDGEDVSKLLNPVVRCSVALIQAVDEWLTAHP